MREFFKGLRRKVGVATLMAACLICVAWRRSYVTQDNIYVPILRRTMLIKSDGGGIRWMRSPFPREFDIESRSDPDRLRFGMYHGLSIHADMVVIPYWLIVLATTLLSAYFLLWKPRKRTTSGHPSIY